MTNSEPPSPRRSSMRRPFLHATAIFLIALGTLAAASPAGRQSPAEPGLTAHEWGTFTTIAGADGLPVEWLPVDLSGPSDLPHFVEHYRNAGFKAGLRGTVRMETPVIYFYSPHETRVSVRVSFTKGLITEWYPHPDGVAPNTSLALDTLYGPHDDGSITWNSVTVSPAVPANFPRESAASLNQQKKQEV